MRKPKLEDYSVDAHGTYDYEKYSKDLSDYIEYIENKTMKSKHYYMFITDVKSQKGGVIYEKGQIEEGVLLEDNTVLFYNPKKSISLNATALQIIEIDELIQMGRNAEKYRVQKWAKLNRL